MSAVLEQQFTELMTAEEFFNLVVDFEKYHEFLKDIKSVKILKKSKISEGCQKCFCC